MAAHAASSKAASAYSVNAPSVYRAPTLAPPAAAAPPAPSSNTQAATEALAGAIAVASGDGDDKPYGSSGGGATEEAAAATAAARGGGGGVDAGEASEPQGAAVGVGGEHESMSSQRAIAPDSSAEVFSSGTGGKGGLGLAGGLRLGGDRMSIPRDGSTLEVRRVLWRAAYFRVSFGVGGGAGL